MPLACYAATPCMRTRATDVRSARQALAHSRHACAVASPASSRSNACAQPSATVSHNASAVWERTGQPCARSQAARRAAARVGRMRTVASAARRCRRGPLGPTMRLTTVSEALMFDQLLTTPLPWYLWLGIGSGFMLVIGLVLAAARRTD